MEKDNSEKRITDYEPDGYNESPKECIQTLEGRFRIVDIIYNEKHTLSWYVACFGEDKDTVMVKGDNIIELLREAVSKSDQT